MIRLNLLPPEIKQEIEYSKKNARLYQYLVRGVAYAFGVFALMFIVGFIVWNNQRIAKDTRDDAHSKLTSMSGIETDAMDVYSRLNLINKIRNERLDWPYIMEEISKSTPTGVRLISYDFSDGASNRVSLSGFADSSSAVGTYRELLSQSSLFDYVDVESLVAGTDPHNSGRNGFSFKISLTLKASEAREK